MKSSLILMACMLILPAFAEAEWSRPFDVEYNMGDGEARVSARQAAIEQIKLKASGEAGTYISRTTVLHENGELTESIQSLGATMVQVIVTGERLVVNPSGQAVLLVSANASIDDTELARRVKAMQEDKEKAKQVQRLQVENNSLRHELDQIHQQLSEKTEPGITAGLLSKQDKAIKRIAENGRTITLVFERGTLLQLASHNVAAFDAVRRQLDERFYEPIMQTSISAEIISVEPSGDGYVARVRVGWQIDTKPLESVLSPYLRFDQDRDKGNLTVYGFHNLDGKGPDVLSEQVYHYLAKKGINLQLRIAGKVVRLPMFYWDNAFMTACGIGEVARTGPVKHLCLVSQNKDVADLRGVHSNINNPIKIRLTRTEAESANEVDASWIIVSSLAEHVNFLTLNRAHPRQKMRSIYRQILC